MSDCAEEFWSTVAHRTASNEATVESWFVLPLLEALGHNPLHIASKVPVLFQEGRNSRRGRKPEADFVVYAEKPFSRATSLIVVESKHPSELLAGGKEQGESYAQNLRTPVLLLTNGERLEVWQLQPTTESERVFSCDMADLAQQRGALEALLTPDALRSHCQQLAYKRFDLLAGDISDFESAAHERASEAAAQAIGRRLKDADAKHERSSNELLNSGERGAVIMASSGYGKTMLARSLLHESVERRWSDPTHPLPIDVFAPDLALSQQTLIAFLAGRVGAHKVGFAEARLREIARSSGLIVIVDGFERVDQVKRSWLEAELRMLLDGYPKVSVYLTSRSGVAPGSLGLPLLTLQPYSSDELRDLAERRSRTLDDIHHVFSSAPSHIYRLGEVPLIADLILDHYAAFRTYPTDLSELFENWLQQILSASDPIDRAFDRKLLEDIAEASVGGPLDVAHAHELAAGRPNPEATLRRLVEQDALSLRGTTVELQHEALADHLRTVRFWASNPCADSAQLDLLAFEPSSQFTLLLVSNAPSPDTRGAVWEAIARRDIALAIRSLRFAGFDRAFTKDATEEDKQRIAGDIQSTIETVIQSHLPNLGPALREEIAGTPVQELGVLATIDRGYVSYQFFEAFGAEQASLVANEGDWPSARRAYGHALNRMGLGPEAGRVLAVNCVRKALDKVINERALIGGRVWTEERTFGRLRHLVREYDFPINPKQFDQSLEYLGDQAGRIVGGRGLNRGQTFLIDELLADLQWLREQGVTELEQWWNDLHDLNLRNPDDRDRLSRTLDAYYGRLQLAYDEVVTRSLPTLRSYLRTLRLMPLRMEIVVRVHERRGFEDVTLNRLRWPVRSFEEAGADVTFSDERPDHHSHEAVERYVQRTDRLLHQFDRYFDARVVSWSEGGLPDLRGGWGSRDQLPDESSIIAGVVDWLKDDLKDLFSEVPSGRWQSSPSIVLDGDPEGYS
ncbi:MAG: type I restriction enzyme HsdR N-terminal domain-containing protein [Pseudomonadota bacterium]